MLPVNVVPVKLYAVSDAVVGTEPETVVTLNFRTNILGIGVLGVT